MHVWRKGLVQAIAGFAIAVEGAGDDVVGEGWGRWLFGPCACLHEFKEVIADELLVETVLVAAGLVLIGGPVAGGVGGEDFVNEDDFVSRFAMIIEGVAELELGVGEDDAPVGGVVGGGFVDGEGDVAEFFHDGLSCNGAGGGEVDVFIVPLFGFGGGSEDGLGELVALAEIGGEGDAADRAAFLIFEPAGAGDVAADNELDGDDLCRPAEHHAALEGFSVGFVEAGDGFGGGGEEVIGNEVEGANEIEPTGADFGEEDAFAGDGGGEDDIEGAHPIGGDDEDGGGLVAGGRNLIEVADLALAAGGEGEIGFVESGRMIHGGGGWIGGGLGEGHGGTLSDRGRETGEKMLAFG